MDREQADRLAVSLDMVTDLETLGVKVGSNSVAVLLAVEDTNVLRFVCTTPLVRERLAGLEFPSGRGFSGMAYVYQQPMRVNDVREDGWAAHYAEIDQATGLTTHNIIIAPVTGMQQEWGLLTAINSERPNGFNTDDLEKLIRSAELIAGELDQTSSRDT